MTAWIGPLVDLVDRGLPVVAVTVAGTRGSTPRETGATMLVTADDTVGTIGGGQLEYECTRIAAGMLGVDDRPVRRTFPLGASMGQCCGGVADVLFRPVGSMAPWFDELAELHRARQPAVLVTDLDGEGGVEIVRTDRTIADTSLPEALARAARKLIDDRSGSAVEGGWLFEPVFDSDFDIAVFGAGHVGSAVVSTLAGLDCNIRWIDSRRGVFGAVPGNVRAIETADPAREVLALPPAAFYLVMTHSHAIDLDITSRILERGDAAYCGLIGSRSKRRRFEKRMLAAGLPAARFDDLRCPIGVDGISGKRPAEIAIAVAAELLRVREARGAAELPANVRRIGKD